MSSPPPVVLLHGMGDDPHRVWARRNWVGALEALGRTVVVAELPGHGSHPPLAGAEWDTYESRVLDQLPSGPVDAIGFSLGARTLLVLAGQHPERFRRIVISGVGSNLFRTIDPRALADELEATRAQIAAGGPDASAALHPVVRPLVEGQPSGATLDTVLAYMRRNFTSLGELYPRITMPTLVVLGELDDLGPADPLLAALPHAEFVELPGVDHRRTTRSELFLDETIRFLSEPDQAVA